MVLTVYEGLLRIRAIASRQIGTLVERMDSQSQIEGQFDLDMPQFFTDLTKEFSMLGHPFSISDEEAQNIVTIEDLLNFLVEKEVLSQEGIES
ncbi:MAG: hypothetical protein Q7S63_01545 [bacterium]|nr:hypothetical protein [bacterium]